ncbi:MAG: hypothetical protein E7290_02085 [Lachnospiraceae bacterium]|nr:hypothetical protein [Lachnospiraceae bacterium]
MNAKTKLKNDIMVGMRMYLDVTTMAILEAVIVKAAQDIEMSEMETLPAAIDDTNKYIIELFMARKANKLSHETVKAYLGTLKEFVEYINKPLNNISESDVEYYLFQKKQLGNSNTSLNNYRRNLSAFFTWMRKVKLVTENPCDGVEPFAQVVKPIEHLEATDVEVIKRGCTSKRDRAILEFLRSTAMRVGEIPSVKISDIDFGTGKIIIYGHKSNRFRPVFLDKVALQYIKEYLEEREVSLSSDEALFTRARNIHRALSADGIYYVVKMIAKRSGVDKRVYPHIFRKTTATAIVRRGGSESAAGEYLGHAPRNVTGRHYTFKSDQYVEQIFHSYVEIV